jgi:hypothetical protein
MCPRAGCNFIWIVKLFILLIFIWTLFYSGCTYSHILYSRGEMFQQSEHRAQLSRQGAGEPTAECSV